jgi:hypothetical protein
VLLIVCNLSLFVSEHLTTGPGDALAMLPGLGRLPVFGLAGNANLIVELVNLLEGEPLGLVDEEVDEGDAQETAGEPDEEDLGLEVGLSAAVVDEVGSRVSCVELATAIENFTVGVNLPIAQLKSQLVAVVILRDLARVLRGKISPVTTQARGPQVEAKKKM